jgi:hypothetical protein
MTTIQASMVAYNPRCQKGPFLLVCLVVPVLVAAAPVPKIGSCPSGYSQSGGFCSPMRDTKCWSFPKTTGQCPSGTIQSGSFCLEINCERKR